MNVNELAEATGPTRNPNCRARSKRWSDTAKCVSKKGKGGTLMPCTRYPDVVLDVSLLASSTARRGPVPAPGTAPAHKLRVCERR
jgi:hypothetical protein